MLLNVYHIWSIILFFELQVTFMQVDIKYHKSTHCIGNNLSITDSAENNVTVFNIMESYWPLQMTVWCILVVDLTIYLRLKDWFFSIVVSFNEYQLERNSRICISKMKYKMMFQ